VELVDGAGRVCFDCLKAIYVRYRENQVG